MPSHLHVNNLAPTHSFSSAVKGLLFSSTLPELVSMDPFVVKLQFEPSGRPESQVDYYLTVKENLCVVCGKRESYIR